jgi:hypothetical protein
MEGFLVRKKIIWSSFFSVFILVGCCCVSSAQMQVFEQSVAESIESSMVENDMVMSVLFSGLHSVVHNGLFFGLTQFAKLYHVFSFISSSALYPVFEFFILFLFSMYTASSIFPVSFVNNQLTMMSSVSNGLSTMIALPLSVLWMGVVMVEMMLFMRYVSIGVFLFLLLYTYILPYWTEFCYYTSF